MPIGARLRAQHRAPEAQPHVGILFDQHAGHPAFRPDPRIHQDRKITRGQSDFGHSSCAVSGSIFVTARWWAVSSLGLAPPCAGLFFWLRMRPQRGCRLSLVTSKIKWRTGGQRWSYSSSAASCHRSRSSDGCAIKICVFAGRAVERGIFGSILEQSFDCIARDRKLPRRYDALCNTAKFVITVIRSIA